MATYPWKLRDVQATYEKKQVVEDAFELELTQDEEGIIIHVELDYDTWEHDFRLNQFQAMNMLTKLRELLGVGEP